MKLFLPSKKSSLNWEETCLRAHCDKTASAPCSSAWFLSPVITQIALLPGATERTPNEPILRYFSTSINWLRWKSFSLEEAGSRKGNKGKGAHEPKAPRPELYPGFLNMKHAWEYCYSLVDRMVVHRRVTSNSMSPVPIHTLGWKETMWS